MDQHSSHFFFLTKIHHRSYNYDEYRKPPKAVYSLKGYKCNQDNQMLDKKKGNKWELAIEKGSSFFTKQSIYDYCSVNWILIRDTPAGGLNNDFMIFVITILIPILTSLRIYSLMTSTCPRLLGTFRRRKVLTDETFSCFVSRSII